MTLCLVCCAATAPDPRLAGLGYVRCSACKLAFKPELAATDLRSEYEAGVYERRATKVGYIADELIEQRRANARSRVRYVERFAKAGRLLDVGAAGGAFVAEAAAAGFDASGIEPSPGFAAAAREQFGVDVREGRVEDLDPATGGYDVITLWHVLEHVADPVAVLSRLRDALAPGGVLVLEVPNLESIVSRLMGPAWTHLDPEVHVCQFTGETLAEALRRAGFVIRECSTVSASSYLGRRERLARGPVGERIKLALRGVARMEDPRRHELLRVAATVSGA